ncbi:MAG: hypothetical protein ACLP8S_04330 [Solirubrobacteraceae bacterium]
MSHLDDIDLTDDAIAEQIFGFDLMTLELGRLAEVTTERAPRGHGRYLVLFRLDEASILLKEGHAGPAAVLAQSVAEGYFQEAMDALFEAQGHGAILSSIKKAVRDFQLSRKDHLGLYTAMTGDSLTQAPFWVRYQAGVQLRNEWVHGPVHGYSDEDAEGTEEFILAVLDLIRHVEATLKRSGVNPAPDRFRVERNAAQRATGLEARVHLLGADEQTVEITIRSAESRRPAEH